MQQMTMNITKILQANHVRLTEIFNNVQKAKAEKEKALG